MPLPEMGIDRAVMKKMRMELVRLLLTEDNADEMMLAILRGLMLVFAIEESKKRRMKHDRKQNSKTAARSGRHRTSSTVRRKQRRRTRSGL
jgi:hypothetical protein